MKSYTTSDIRKIREMAITHTPEVIAELLGRTPSAIRTCASRNGIKVARKQYHYRGSQVRRKAEELRQRGDSYRAIANAINVPLSTCMHWLRGGANATDVVRP